MLSFIVIDSRSDVHPNWVGQCFQSLEAQTLSKDKYEVIVVPNLGREKTIGQCWNEGVKEAQGDWCVFVGDDDFVAPEYAEILWNWIRSDRVRNSKIKNVATYMTAWNEESPSEKKALARQSTGAFPKEYLLEYPFNEKLLKGIDREYLEKMITRGDLSLIIEYYFGYMYRRHDDYHCAGTITFHKEAPDYYFVTSNRIFLHPITEGISKRGKVFVEPHFTPEFAKGAKTIWVEWANQKAIDVANFETDAKKILRLHAYEAFTDLIKKKELDLRKFDTVIFIDDYIKDFIERKYYGKLDNAVIIPNGVDLERYKLLSHPKNNKIAYAGYLTRKKGIGELLLMAESLPEYEFYLAGKFQEDDIADFFNYKKPDNVFLEEWKYDEAMIAFYKDKSFILNTSMRESQAMTIMEGMACGLKPLVRNWMGVEDVYPEEYVYKNINELKDMLQGDYNPEEYRSFIEQNYNIKDIYPKIEEQILTEVKV